MYNKTILLFIYILFIFLYSNSNGLAISTAVKAGMDYKTILQNLRFSTIAAENFADEGQKKKFEEIKTLFRDASAEHYGQRYEIAFIKFNKVKEDLFPFLDEISLIYLNRSKEILDSTAKPALDIIIKYARNTTFSNYFKNPFDPIENKKGYNEKEYHFYHDRARIESYLNNGYRNLAEANKIYNDADFIYIKTKKKKTSKNLDFILERYTTIITLCRQAKMYGMEIYKIFNDDKTGDIIIKHRIIGEQIEPIFDDRIPDVYKIDAVDIAKMIYSVEKSKLGK